MTNPKDTIESPERIAILAHAEACRNARLSGEPAQEYTGPILVGCDLSDLDLREILLCNEDLRHCNFGGANLSGASITDCDLRGCDLRDANLDDACLHGSDLRSVQFSPETSCSTTRFYNADLRGVDLSQMDMSSAAFNSADLRRASFYGANLEGADFGHADLRGVAFGNANLTNVDFTAADIRGAEFRSMDDDGCCDILPQVAGVTWPDGKKANTTEQSDAIARQVATTILANLDRFDMNVWHSRAKAHCGTTHCLAGWAEVITDGIEVPGLTNTHARGLQLVPTLAHLFFELDDDGLVLETLREIASNTEPNEPTEMNETEATP